MKKRVFISHSGNDQSSAEAFVGFLEKLGVSIEQVTCFSHSEAAFAIGSKWQDEILTSVEECDVFFVLYSRDYQHSHICQKELGMAVAFRKDIYWMSVEGTLPSDPYLSELNGVISVDSMNLLMEELINKLNLSNLKPTQIRSALRILGDEFSVFDGKKNWVMKRGEIPNDLSYIDATLYISGREFFDPSTTVQKLVKGNVAIPEELQYVTPSGADSWVKLCDDEQYATFQASLKFFQNNAARILDAIGDDVVKLSPDFISLGPGNGKKDKYLLRELVAKSQELSSRPVDVYYYPYDLSIDLLKSSIKEVCASEVNREHLKIKAICADFKEIRQFKSIFDFRPEPNIFALLGNTLGNLSDELRFLGILKNAMNDEDFLILEVRLIEGLGTAAPGGVEDRRKKFNFAPLAQIGVKYSKSKLRYKEHAIGLSQINGTKTIQGIYGPYQHNKIEYRTQLCAINHYNMSELCNALTGLGFRIVKQFVSSDNALGTIILTPDVTYHDD